MPYNLTNNPILTSYQVQILRAFFATDFAKPFFLTGGTALSGFYFAHRESQDLDFFSLTPIDTLQLNQITAQLATLTHATITTKMQTPMYYEIYLENKPDNWIQRLDFVQEQPVRFGELANIDGVMVDSLENIGSNKICAILGRLEVKDYIDLYTILHQSPFTFEQLFDLAKQKDLGLNEFTFASSIGDISQISAWPKLHTALEPITLNEYFQQLATKLLQQIKPTTSN